LQKPDDAIAAFRFGIETAPDDEMIYMNLARVYVRLGDHARARQVLQLLQARKPDSGLARRALDELDKRN
jgi:tetratricopeptide (TPR) repeat protein